MQTRGLYPGKNLPAVPGSLSSRAGTSPHLRRSRAQGLQDLQREQLTVLIGVFY